MLQQLLLDPGRVRRRKVDLVHRDDDRLAGVLGMADRLAGLRHHAVVRGDHQDDDVGDVRAAGAHGGERCVPRSVEESDATTLTDADRVGTDMLCDSTGLTGDHVRLANVVQQRCLAVIDVAHDGDDRRPRLQTLGMSLVDLFDHVGAVLVLTHRLVTELIRD